MAGRAERAKILDELVKKTHFDAIEVKHLQRICKALNESKKIDRQTFREVLNKSFNMTEDQLMDRVFLAFASSHENILSEEEWVCGMSVFLKGTLEEQMKFTFKVYDLNGDGHIVREEIFLLLKSSIVKSGVTDEDRDEGIKDLVDLVMKKMDHDHDGRLSVSDYEESVKNEPLLLEAFGPCLPNKKQVNAFLSASAIDLYE